MVYHATPPGEGAQVEPFPLLPLRGEAKGPAPRAAPGAKDVVDEALDAFRANILFKSFSVENPADKILLYATLVASCCLQRWAEVGAGRAEAERLAYALAHAPFSLPGQAGFPLSGLFPKPESDADAEALRAYLAQVREEAGRRLAGRCYDGDALCKHWAAFAGRRFLNLALD